MKDGSYHMMQLWLEFDIWHFFIWCNTFLVLPAKNYSNLLFEFVKVNMQNIFQSFVVDTVEIKTLSSCRDMLLFYVSQFFLYFISNYYQQWWKCICVCWTYAMYVKNSVNFFCGYRMCSFQILRGRQTTEKLMVANITLWGRENRWSETYRTSCLLKPANTTTTSTALVSRLYETLPTQWVVVVILVSVDIDDIFLPYLWCGKTSILHLSTVEAVSVQHSVHSWCNLWLL